MTTTETMTDFTARTFEHAGESFRQTMETGSRMMDEMTRLMNVPCQKTGFCGELQDRGEKFATEMFPTMQKNFDAAREAFDHHCKSNVDFMHKAFEQTRDRSPQEIASVSGDLMKDSFSTVQKNFETMTKMQTAMINNWSDFFSRTMGFAPFGGNGSMGGQSKSAAKSSK